MRRWEPSLPSGRRGAAGRKVEGAVSVLPGMHASADLIPDLPAGALRATAETIRELPHEERPRERNLTRGRQDAVTAEDFGTCSSHAAYRSSLPVTAARYVSWIDRVIGPGSPIS